MNYARMKGGPLGLFSIDVPGKTEEAGYSRAAACLSGE